MKRPEVVLIAAIAEQNRVIGKDGKLPWYISEDLRRFKQLTVGHAVLMGRKTFESILERLDKPLPKRRNLVLSSKRSYLHYPNVEIFNSIGSALAAGKSERIIFVIGGEAVFEKTLGKADRLELTLVEGNYDGDAFFPEYEHLLTEQFVLAKMEKREGYRFETHKLKLG